MAAAADSAIPEVTEVTSLLRHRRSFRRLSTCGTCTKLDEAILESAFNFQADINGSAFVLPSSSSLVGEELDEEASSSGAVASPPLRAGTHLIMLGMFSGGFLAALEYVPVFIQHKVLISPV